MIRVRMWTALLAVAVLGGSACKKDEKGKSEESAAKTTATPPKESPTPAAGAEKGSGAEKPGDEAAAKPEPVAKAPASDVKVDEEVLAEIKSIASACEVDVKGARFDCKNKEDELLSRGFYGYGDKEKDRVATIGTFAVALNDADPKVQTVAAKVLSSAFSSGWKGAEVGQVDKKVAELLRKAVPTLGQYQGRGVIVPVVYASSLSESDEEMYALLEGHSDEYLVHKGWSATMFYGRMKAFEKVKGLAATGDAKKILTAVTAANNMYKYTDEERGPLCPWAHSLLGADAEGAKESEVFEQAGFVLTKCGGEWIDKLLDWGEAKRKENVFDRRYYFVYRELCHSVMSGVAKVAASPEQCERNFKFLEKTANTKGIEAQHRAWALDSIAYARRDAKSHKLMKKYAKSKVPEIKKVAEDSLKMLESYVKKK